MSMKRFGKFDIIVVALSAIGLVVCGFALVNERFLLKYFIQGSSTVQKIGTIQSAKNDVRRRMNQSLTFYSATQSEDLYERDNVFTGSDSEVTMQIGSTSGITVGENSLVVLKTIKDQIALDLQVGTISATTAPKQKLQIMLQGEMTEVSSSNGTGPIVISKSESGDVEIASKGDGLEVKVGNKLKQLQKYESLTIDSKKQTSKKSRPVRITNKPLYEKVVGNDIANLDLKLETNEPERTLKYELSRQPSFRNVESSQDIAGLDVSLPVPDKSGVYYYRILDAKTGDVLSSTHRFERVVDLSPLLNLPENNKRFITKGNVDNLAVQFDWDKVGSESVYILEISHSEKFDGSVRKETIPASRVQLILDKGDYYWRVRVAAEAYQAHWSEVRHFELSDGLTPLPVAQTPDALPTTQTSGPLGGEETGALKATDESPTAEDIAMQKPFIGPKPLVGPFQPDIRNLLPQKISVNDSDNPLPVNKSQKFVLSFAGGVNARDPASITKSIVNPPVLKWKHAKEKANYVVELSAKKDFSQSEKIPVSNKKQVDLKGIKPGEYYWRVLENDSVDATKVSTEPIDSESVAMIDVKIPKPELEGAEDVLQKTTDANELKKPHEYHIKWKELPFAKGYRVKLNEQSKVIRENEIKFKVNPGENTKIKIAATGENDRVIGEPVERSLAYKVELEMKAPDPVLPADKTTIVAFDKDTLDPVLFSWTNIAGATYEVEFSSTNDFTKVIKTISAPTNKFVLKEQLASGPIYWRVRALAGNNKSSWSNVRMFER